MSSIFKSSKSKGLFLADSDGESGNSLSEIVLVFGSSLGSSNEFLDMQSDGFSEIRFSDSALSELSTGAAEQKKDGESACWESLMGSLKRDSGHGVLISAPNTDDDQSECEVNLVPLQLLLIDENTSADIRSKNIGKCFHDFYNLGDDHLGSGAYACVRTATSIATGIEFAAKIINRHVVGHTRERILREVDIFERCRNHPNIIQLIECFFYVVVYIAVCLLCSFTSAQYPVCCYECCCSSRPLLLVYHSVYSFVGYCFVLSSA